MQNRKTLLEKITKLEDIEFEKQDASKNQNKFDLHDQKYKGLQMLERRLRAQTNDNISNVTLCQIVSDVVKSHPRFAEGFNSEIKKFLNECAPCWNVPVGPTLFANPPEKVEEKPIAESGSSRGNCVMM